MSYNLFLDDLRDPNLFFNDTKTWVVVRNHSQFVETITKRGLPDFISFDHDLAWEHYPMNNAKTGSVILKYDTYKEKTGYDCAKWLVEYCMRINHQLPEWKVHSMNPIGRDNINAILTRYRDREEDIYE